VALECAALTHCKYAQGTLLCLVSEYEDMQTAECVVFITLAVSLACDWIV
jgi:hypothetical protein